MAKLFGIELAPLHVPIERRLQTLTVIFYVLTFTLWPVLCVLLCIGLLFTPLFWVAIAYWSWVFYDVVINQTSSQGGRRIEWCRRHWIWKYFVNYFPMELIKKQDLDPENNYIMGYHPHGIIGCGAIGNFASEATGFGKLYPGIKPHPMTLKPNFRLPILRGFLLYMGMCDVSKESIEWLMTKQGKGNAAVIVVGGAEEALEAHPGNYKLTLLKRKGFIKLAIKTGADLVPIFSFGENDLFIQADNPHGSRLRNFQNKFKQLFGVSPPMFHGRGIFNYSFGILPFRKPIRSVVGAPIKVEQNKEPKQEDIDKYHALYLQGLSDTFDGHKEAYGVDKDVKLEFI